MLDSDDHEITKPDILKVDPDMTIESVKQNIYYDMNRCLERYSEDEKAILIDLARSEFEKRPSWETTRWDESVKQSFIKEQDLSNASDTFKIKQEVYEEIYEKDNWKSDQVVIDYFKNHKKAVEDEFVDYISKDYADSD